MLKRAFSIFSRQSAATTSKVVKNETKKLSASEILQKAQEKVKDPKHDASKPIIWIDCEMTGLDHHNDTIIEICCLITDKNLNLIDDVGYESVIHESKEKMDAMGEWCILHHGQSGLTEKVIESKKTKEQVEEELLTYISKYMNKGVGILAGNSVHMDRLFMLKDMPRVVDYLMYRIIDVSSIMEISKRFNPIVAASRPRKKGAHTAHALEVPSIQSTQPIVKIEADPLIPDPQLLQKEQQQQQPNMPSQMNNSSSFSFENFHLDPQDFQNFLLINPPLTEYSSHYLNFSNSNNGMNSSSYTNQQRQIPNNHSFTNNTSTVNNVIRDISEISPASSNEHSNQLIDPSKSTPNSADALLKTSANTNLDYLPATDVTTTTTSTNVVDSTTTGTSANYLNLQNIPNQQIDQTQQQFNRSNNHKSHHNIHSLHYQQQQHQNHHQQQHHQQQQLQQQQQQNHHHHQQQSQLFSNNNPYAFDFDINQPLPSRRLSISNGQIGQISMMVHSQMHPNSNASDTPPQSNNSISHINSSGSNSNIKNDGHIQQHQTSATQGNTDLSVLPDDLIEVDTNGVPVRQLMYNNEVIFNPNGPIPGTNAWKRTKILERNRIAASKCRAKKKNLQKKLQQDVDDLNDENSRLRDMLNEMKFRAERYCQKNNLNMSDIFSSEGEIIKREDDDEKMKRLKAQHTKAHVDVFIKDGFL
ncbi:hypothetical protein C6P42_004465 [Pichia californica]|nr:hypothetical protein C6P42_004465 [[Candida] californica]